MGSRSRHVTNNSLYIYCSDVETASNIGHWLKILWISKTELYTKYNYTEQDKSDENGSQLVGSIFSHSRIHVHVHVAKICVMNSILLTRVQILYNIHVHNTYMYMF